MTTSTHPLGNREPADRLDSSSVLSTAYESSDDEDDTSLYVTQSQSDDLHFPTPSVSEVVISTSPEPLATVPRTVLPLVKLQNGEWKWQNTYREATHFGNIRQSTRIACLGANNTAKSSLLNTLFGLGFPVSNGITTTGIDVGLCMSSQADDEGSERRALVIYDIAGGDALDREMSVDENNRMALFAFLASDIVIVNIRYDERTRAAGSFVRSLGRVFEGLQDVHTQADGIVAPARTLVYAIRDYASQEPQETVEQQIREAVGQEWDRMQRSDRPPRTLDQVFNVRFMFLTNAVPVDNLLPTTCDPDHERILKGERAREWLVGFQWAAIDQFETILSDAVTVHAERLLLSSNQDEETCFTRSEALWELSGKAKMTSMDHDRLAKQIAFQEDSNLFLSNVRNRIDGIIQFDVYHPVSWNWPLWGEDQCEQWRKHASRYYGDLKADVSCDRICDEIRALAHRAVELERRNNLAIRSYWAEYASERAQAENLAKNAKGLGIQNASNTVRLRIQMTAVWCRARASQQNDNVWLCIAARQPGQEPFLWAQLCKKMRERKGGLPYTTPYGTVLTTSPGLPIEISVLLVNMARGSPEAIKAIMLRRWDQAAAQLPPGSTILRDVLDQGIPLAGHLADGFLVGSGQVLRVVYERIARPQLNNRDCILAFDNIRFEDPSAMQPGVDYGFRRSYRLRHDALDAISDYEPVFGIHVL